MGRRRGGFGSILVILAGAWLIGQLVGGEPEPRPASTTNERGRTPEATKSNPASEDARKKPPNNIQAEVAQERPLWLKGNKVALRAGPGKTFAVLDRYGVGRSLVLLATDGEWSKVRDNLTRREGWIATALLTDRKPERRKPQIREEPEPPREVPVIAAKPQTSDAEIVERIIQESIANYSGNCPCPFNRDSANRRCGKRSAYSRPGGQSPICFVQDVTPDMIAAFRNR